MRLAGEGWMMAGSGLGLAFWGGMEAEYGINRWPDGLSLRVTEEG